MTIFIGLDLSLVSPGIAVHNTTTGSWVLYGFTQRVREQRFTYINQSTRVHLFPAIPRVAASNEERYEHIRHHIVECILLPLLPTTERVVIGIECYAFGAKNSGSSFKLQELGGVLKHDIWRRFPAWQQVIIPPTQWKKQVLDNGRATKSDALRFITSNGPCISLMSVLGLIITKNGDIPCPAQDLADASCIVLSLIQPVQPITEVPRKKKRKRQPSQKQQSPSNAYDLIKK
jgi:hypothetical protein